MKSFFKLLLLALFSMVSMAMNAKNDDIVKILSIGNSFSQDAVEQYLHEIAAADGRQVIIGNMYIGGCSLAKHLVNAKENSDILHLFAFIPEQKGTATQIIEDEITVTDLEISLATQGRSVKKIFSTAREIPFVFADGHVRFTLDRMQGFEAVTVEYN